MTKDLFMAAIRNGGFDLSAMLNRIDEYHIHGKLSDSERDELQAAARGDANPQLDLTKEIQLLWEAVRNLEDKLNGTDGETPTGVPEYVQPTGGHDAYFAGDKAVYNGTVYTCVAPAGVACVWSPDVMPSYWQAN